MKIEIYRVTALDQDNAADSEPALISQLENACKMAALWSVELGMDRVDVDTLWTSPGVYMVEGKGSVRLEAITLTQGTRVRLAPFDNGEEVIPAEEGEVVSAYVADNGDKMVVVHVDPEYSDSMGDDGLREVHVDQIEEVL